MLNKLYAILTNGVDTTDSWYHKKHDGCALSNKMAELVKALTTKVPDSKRALFACLLCEEAKYTKFGSEIMEHDSNNTYTEVQRDPNAVITDKDCLVYDMTAPLELYSRAKTLLDQDITDRISGDSWMEFMAGCCLQLLREADK